MHKDDSYANLRSSILDWHAVRDLRGKDRREPSGRAAEVVELMVELMVELIPKRALTSN